MSAFHRRYQYNCGCFQGCVASGFAYTCSFTRSTAILMCLLSTISDVGFLSVIPDTDRSHGIFLYSYGRMPHGIRGMVRLDLVNPTPVGERELFGKSPEMFLDENMLQMILRCKRPVEIDRACGNHGELPIEIL